MSLKCADRVLSLTFGQFLQVTCMHELLQKVMISHAKTPSVCKKLCGQVKYIHSYRIIPESECMKRSVTIRSDITMRPRLSVLNQNKW